MSAERPSPVGTYELVQDFINAQASIRILAMDAVDEEVQAHIHTRTTQVYVVLEGRAAIEVDGVEQIYGQYDCVNVPVRSLHRARPVGGPAIIMNLSVPPLAADDQSYAHPQEEHPDLRLPGEGGDVDD